MHLLSIDGDGSDSADDDVVLVSETLAPPRTLRMAATVLPALHEAGSLPHAQLLDLLIDAAVQEPCDSVDHAASMVRQYFVEVSKKTSGTREHAVLAKSPGDPDSPWQLGMFALRIVQRSERVFECVPLLAQQLQRHGWQGRGDERQLGQGELAYAELLRACNAAAAKRGGVAPFEECDVAAAAELCWLLW
jgi:hypothetical protein